jgi:hypothetical protein
MLLEKLTVSQLVKIIITFYMYTKGIHDSSTDQEVSRLDNTTSRV